MQFFQVAVRQLPSFGTQVGKLRRGCCMSKQYREFHIGGLPMRDLSKLRYQQNSTAFIYVFNCVFRLSSHQKLSILNK